MSEVFSKSRVNVSTCPSLFKIFTQSVITKVGVHPNELYHLSKQYFQTTYMARMSETQGESGIES